MKNPGYIVVTVLSLVPPVVFLFAALFEPMFYGIAWNSQEVAEVGDAVRISSALLVLAMIVFYGVYLHRLDDPKVDQEKRSLWTWILLLGNVFALPVVWYVFIWRQRRAQGAS